jgi:uncharacterized protein YbcI
VKTTKNRMEAEINEAVIKFEKEYMGHGPLEAKTHIIDDLILVRLKGVMTKAELQLATAADNPRGRMLIKEVRRELLEKGRPLLEAVIQAITKRRIVSLHTDISTITGERIIVFVLDCTPQYEVT